MSIPAARHGLLAVALLPSLAAALPIAVNWSAQGPAPILGGQVEGMLPQFNPVAGALHTVVAHPSDPDILWVGGVNSGVWRTGNATDPNGPTWTPLTDFESSLSIGALALDPTDPSAATLVAGIGRYSSLAQLGGARTGLLRSSDGGGSWTALDGGGVLDGKNISGVAARGDTLVVSVNVADNFTFGNIGVFRSSDGGASFTRISNGDGSATGLPGGVAYDLASDPGDPATLYTSALFADFLGGSNGIYQSTDTGATWIKVSDAAIDGLIDDFQTSNIEISVGSSGEVYAGIINQGQLAGLFRSGDGGASWTVLDTPVTNENGALVGLQPRPKGGGPGDPPEAVAGGQGSIHFSILADPTDPHVVYLGGDRQPLSEGPLSGGFPNSIGAGNFSGRLFRVDASLPPGSQATALTHNPSTFSNSAPHADSREMVFDANGDLIEVDDGGVYRRGNPGGFGDWFSLNGNIQSTEFHSVDWDANTDTILAGSQDVGTPEQVIPGFGAWLEVTQGDGGQVAVDDADPSRSIRYSSFQNFQGFLRRVIDPVSGAVLAAEFPDLMIAGSGGQSLYDLDPNIQFYTPIALNSVNQNLYIGTGNVYESMDGGDTLFNLGFLGDFVNAIEAGGRSGGLDLAEILYAGAGNQVFLRDALGGALAPVPGYAGETVIDLTIDTGEWRKLFLVDGLGRVFMSPDGGLSFQDITGDLSTGGLLTIEYLPLPGLAFDALLVGGLDGVFYSITDDLGRWLELGATTLPNALVYDLVYDPADDVLLAGLLGRGAWTVAGAGAAFIGQAIAEPASPLLWGIALAGLVLARRTRVLA